MRLELFRQCDYWPRSEDNRCFNAVAAFFFIASGSAKAFIAGFLASLFIAPPSFAQQASTCTKRITEYVEQVDKLLEAEQNTIRPYLNLNRRVFPLKSCDVDELIRAIGKSRHYKTIETKPDTLTVFVLGHGNIEVGFAYSAKKKSSELEYARVSK